jgi:hypothetical protein
MMQLLPAMGQLLTQTIDPCDENPEVGDCPDPAGKETSSEDGTNEETDHEEQTDGDPSDDCSETDTCPVIDQNNEVKGDSDPSDDGGA